MDIIHKLPMEEETAAIQAQSLGVTHTHTPHKHTQGKHSPYYDQGTKIRKMESLSNSTCQHAAGRMARRITVDDSVGLEGMCVYIM